LPSPQHQQEEDQSHPQEEDQGHPARGINLWVVYGLIFFGLVVAIGLAALIVLPFYNRR